MRKSEGSGTALRREGAKSIRFDELNEEYFMSLKNNCFVPYLDYIQKDLDSRD